MDALFGRLMTDFRPADDDADLRGDHFQHGDELGRLLDVPDVDTQPDHLWIQRKQRLEQRLGATADDEFDDAGIGAQIVIEIGVEITQPQGRVGVAGVERAENERWHAAIIGEAG